MEGATNAQVPTPELIKTEKISLSGNDKLSLVSNLSTMLTAGIPILETVDSLLEDAKGNQRKLLQIIRDNLMQGKHMYVSFSRFPEIFDKVTVNIVKASEEAGTLDVALKDLKSSIKKDMEFNDRIKSALFYPMFILLVFAGVLLMILTVVVPKISTVFLRLNIDLPLPTQILIFTSNVLLTYTIPVIVGFLLLIAGIVYGYKKNKRLFLSTLFKLPLIAHLAKEIDLTRFSHSMYLLLNAGIPITAALELTEEVVMKKEVSVAIRHAKEVVSSGRKLSQAFKDSRSIYPSIMIKITEAGEKTGSLEKSMEDTSEYLDYQVAKTLKTVTALIEPIMLVFVGVLVGGMMLAIIAPIYNLIGQVGSR